MCEHSLQYVKTTMLTRDPNTALERAAPVLWDPTAGGVPLTAHVHDVCPRTCGALGVGKCMARARGSNKAQLKTYPCLISCLLLTSQALSARCEDPPASELGLDAFAVASGLESARCEVVLPLLASVISHRSCTHALTRQAPR